jgi:hypothetical protein
VRFSLRSTEPARLELVDVSGRKVVERTVAGAGPHVANFGRERLAAGIYFIRLSQGPNTRVRRAVVLE